VEGIRTKLDRTYLEALNAPVQNIDSTSQDVPELQEELESLYAEILPVAQMSAEQQYLQPALRTISAKNGQGQDRTVKAVKYVWASCCTVELMLTACRCTIAYNI
jgi:hypothetical protein